MTTLFMMTFFFYSFLFLYIQLIKILRKKLSDGVFVLFSCSCFALRTYLSAMTAFWITSFGFSV